MKLKAHEAARAMGDAKPQKLPGKRHRRPKNTPRPRAIKVPDGEVLAVDAALSGRPFSVLPCRNCGAVRNAGPTCEPCGASYY